MKRCYLPVVLILMVMPCYNISADVINDAGILAKDNSAFAFDLYGKLRAGKGSIFFSPYSISDALAMTYGGARGNTEKEMAKTLRFSLGQKGLHPAFAELESHLNEIQRSGNVNLSVANSIWPKEGYNFLPEYIDLLKKYYGVSVTPLDYANAVEASRKTINKWVEDKTRDKIKELIKPGLLDNMTRLVLTNAIYFKGNWASQFKPDATRESEFIVSPGKSVKVRMMNRKGEYRYAELDSLQVLELPYAGDELSMLVLLPKQAGGLEALERALSLENLDMWKGRLEQGEVDVFLPKFKMTSQFELKDTLSSMGMVDAFTGGSDFSGMDGTRWLFISAVIHKAFVDVNEKGTEAAAATAVIVKLRSMPMPASTFRADHPFIFLIQDNKTGSILFMGRVMDPADTGE